MITLQPDAKYEHGDGRISLKSEKSRKEMVGNAAAQLRRENIISMDRKQA